MSRAVHRSQGGPVFSPSTGTIGPYEVLGLLGQGGMAAVYLARDGRSGEEVAVKVLSRLRPSWVKRFAREFDAARRVHHPNVVRVLEGGEHDGVAYFSMERVHGRSAARWVRDLDETEPLPPPPPLEPPGAAEPVDVDVLQRVVHVAIQLAAAVGAIHRVGLVHRDLKPGNVLVTEGGVVKLVDFGVAKWLEEQTSFTKVGHVVGSYSYMSPEQITGAEVDHRADLYGMGVLLYELILGAPPFRARRPQEFLWLHCTAEPEPLSRRLTGVPPELDALLLRMLAKEPADRPDSMQAVERELVGIRAQVDGVAAGASLEFLPLEEEDLPGRHGAFDGAATEEPTLRSSDEVFQRLRERARRMESGAAEPTEFPRGGTAGSTALAALVTPKHVGRRNEQDTLLAHLKGTARAGARAVLIEGEDGLGKTRLLEAFRGLAWVKGGRVAIGRCHATGGAFCAPFHDILLRLAGPGLARAHVDRVLGPDRVLLQRFFPALGTSGPRPPPGVGPALREHEERSTLLTAVGEMMRRVASDAPLVIGIEDVHYADEGTLRLVDSLLHRLAPPTAARVLIVLTYRAEELVGNVPTTAAIEALRARPNAFTMPLRPLSPAETEEVVRSVVLDVPVPDEVIARLAESSRGNPRFAVEVARTLVERGGARVGEEWRLPRSVLGAYRGRLERLGERSREVVRCVAVLGGRPPSAVVSAASGLDDDDFAAALMDLERRRVLSVDTETAEEPMLLSSDALRTAVLDLLSERQERSLHRRAAAAWLRVGTGESVSEQAAKHLYAAGEDRAAFPHALEAAFRAAQRLDYVAAARWMAKLGAGRDERLKEVSPEANYRCRIVDFMLAFGDGRLDEAEAAIAAAAAAAPDPLSRLRTGLFVARLHTRTGNYLAAVQVCRRGLAESRKAEAFEEAVQFATQGARAARRSGDYASALAWLNEADLLLGDHPELEALAVRAAWSRSAVLLELQRDEDAEPAIQKAIALAVKTRQERAEAGLRTNLSVLHWRRGDTRAATAEVERAVRIFEKLGEAEQVALNQGNLAELRLMQGKVEDARRLATSAWVTFRRLQDQRGVVIAGAVLLGVCTAGGDRVQAEAVIATVGDGPGAERRMEAFWADYWLARARWHRECRQGKAAWFCVEQAARALGASPPENRRRDVQLLQAELLYDGQRDDRAEALLERVLAGAESEGHAPVAWWARAVLAAALARAGRMGEDEPVRPPAALLEDHLPLALATGWYHAAAWRRLGREEWARTLLKEGLESARTRGFKDWEARYREAIVADADADTAPRR